MARLSSLFQRTTQRVILGVAENPLRIRPESHTIQRLISHTIQQSRFTSAAAPSVSTSPINIVPEPGSAAAFDAYWRKKEIKFSPKKISFSKITLDVVDLALSSRFDDLKTYVDDFKTLHPLPDATKLCNLVMNNLAHKARTDDFQMRAPKAAIGLFEFMKRENIPVTVITLNSVLQSLVEARMAETSEAFLRRVDVKGIDYDMFTYNIRMNGAVRKGNTWQALQFMKEAESKGLMPDAVTYSTLIKGFVQDKKVDEAVKWLLTMTQKGMPPSARLFKMVIKGFIWANNVSDAEELYRLSRDRGVMHPSETFEQIVNEARQYRSTYRVRRQNPTPKMTDVHISRMNAKNNSRRGVPRRDPSSTSDSAPSLSTPTESPVAGQGDSTLGEQGKQVVQESPV
mmetsp:Transcript_15637/g.25936  ORF Transcript_15637/g.25936 Transcript_15637/m.25936 type:complete len:399 (+) Transcript_15637:145-1341(+)